MSVKNKIIKIERAVHIEGYNLRIIFNDGKEQVVDFKPFLENSLHPEIKKFLNLKNFKKFTTASVDLMWGDFDLIFPIMDLYENNLDEKIVSKSFMLEHRGS